MSRVPDARSRGLAITGATPADVGTGRLRAAGAHLLRKRGSTHPSARTAALGQYRSTASKQASISDEIAQTFRLDASAINAQYVEHHPAHLASAFYASGVSDAACCAIDGFGDFVSVRSPAAAQPPT
jgi:carbamoyltransferase